MKCIVHQVWCTRNSTSSIFIVTLLLFSCSVRWGLCRLNCFRWSIFYQWNAIRDLMPAAHRTSVTAPEIRELRPERMPTASPCGLWRMANVKHQLLIWPKCVCSCRTHGRPSASFNLNHIKHFELFFFFFFSFFNSTFLLLEDSPEASRK